ncbi:hypothetical protein [Streptomyces avermitilis]|uniref:PIN-like domain-containing protein n=1 Tax=Streptomyces avermitilis TaxID=33903 RepID=UPI003826AC13
MPSAKQWCILPPEFFLDRNLGRRVAEGLRADGWKVHRIGDVFPDDGQSIPRPTPCEATASSARGRPDGRTVIGRPAPRKQRNRTPSAPGQHEKGATGQACRGLTEP